MDSAIRKHGGLLGVEIRHLAALEAIADERSFARAAARLGYSQSAISQQIAALERAAGTRLLDRPVGRRTVTVTEAGERLLRHARRVAGSMRAAEADLAALAEGSVGTLHVGTFQSASVRLLPRVLSAFVERRPGIDVQLFEADWEEEIHERLHNGMLELTFRLRTDEEGIASIPVLTDPYVVLVPRSSPLGAGGRPLRLRDVASQPLIAYKRPEGGEAALLTAGVTPRIAFRSDEIGVVQGLVGAGLGIALVPRLTVWSEDPATRAVAVTGIPPREIVLAWLEDRTLTPGALAFVDVVEEVARELASQRPPTWP